MKYLEIDYSFTRVIILSLYLSKYLDLNLIYSDFPAGFMLKHFNLIPPTQILNNKWYEIMEIDQNHWL